MSDTTTPVNEVEEATVPTATKPEWPLDTFGFTNALRRELVRAIGRVHGNADKAEILRETLRAGARHLHARLPVQEAINERALAGLYAQDEAATQRAKIEVGGPAPKPDAVAEGNGNAKSAQAPA